MDNAFRSSLLTVCKLLEKHTIQYLLVGGAAVALNGYYRHSIDGSGQLAENPDIDIWYKPTYGNYFNFLKVIEDLGQDISEFKKEKSPNPRKSFFKLDFDSFTLDAIPEIKANIRFDDANLKKEIIELEGTKIHVLNYQDLIEDKKATARSKDIKDIAQLQELKDNL